MALWTPSAISTALWLDAADSSTLFDAVSGGGLVAADGAVARWEDKSGNGRNATQELANRRPIRLLAIQNGLDGLSFDGINDYLFSPDWYASDIACFVVARKPNTTEQRFVSKFDGLGGNREYIFDATSVQRIVKNAVGTSGAENQLLNGEVIGTGWNVLGFLKQSTNATLSLNGNITTGSFASSGVFDGPLSWTIGADSNGIAPLNGNIAEIVMVSSSIDAAIRQIVEGYLAWKWGLQSSLPNDHPYKNAAPLLSKYAVNGKEPIAAWIPSRDTSGNGTTTLTDLVGSNNGTLTNMDAATDWVADTGAGGVRALDFDGVNDFVNVPSSATLNVPGAITVSSWFNLNAAPVDNQGIAAKWRTATPLNGRQYNLGVGAGSLVFGGISSNGTFQAGNFITSPSAVSNNVWNHAALVFTPGVSISLYVNGVSAASSATAATAIFQGTAPLTIGHQANLAFPNLHFNGRIDDVRLFDQSLSLAEIQYLYAGGLGRGITKSGGIIPILRQHYAAMGAR